MLRPHWEVADVFRHYGTDYRHRHTHALSRGQRRVMSAITGCRTAVLGGHLEQCDSCGHQRPAYNSCRNRHCPKCQSLARAQWLKDRQAELLPVEYFHVVFTVPEEIAAVAYQNKETVYGILFRAVSETLRTIAADPKHLGAEIGFLAILHTWGQNLLHHPHLHCVVPGGGISPDRQRRWLSLAANPSALQARAYRVCVATRFGPFLFQGRAATIFAIATPGAMLCCRAETLQGTIGLSCRAMLWSDFNAEGSAGLLPPHLRRSFWFT